MCLINHIRTWNTFKLKPGKICYQEIQAELYLGFLVTLFIFQLEELLTHAFPTPISIQAVSRKCPFDRNPRILNSRYCCYRQDKNRTKIKVNIDKNVEFLCNFLLSSKAYDILVKLLNNDNISVLIMLLILGIGLAYLTILCLPRGMCVQETTGKNVK